jgi:hypothetical protein
VGAAHSKSAATYTSGKKICAVPNDPLGGGVGGGKRKE